MATSSLLCFFLFLLAQVLAYLLLSPSFFLFSFWVSLFCSCQLCHLAKTMAFSLAMAFFFRYIFDAGIKWTCIVFFISLDIVCDALQIILDYVITVGSAWDTNTMAHSLGLWTSSGLFLMNIYSSSWLLSKKNKKRKRKRSKLLSSTTTFLLGVFFLLVTNITWTYF